MTITELLNRHKILKRTSLGKLAGISNFPARLYRSPGYRIRPQDRDAIAEAITALGHQLIEDADRLTADPEPVKIP